MMQIIHGDCFDVLKTQASDSVDACVTDPPYELGFMGKKWDRTGIAYNPALWCEVLRVLKPGAHLVSFGGTRTYHRMACAVEDAGFDIRDQLAWCFGTGFPKSLNLEGDSEGWGTGLKPGWEPICLARKPFCGTVQENVAKYGTGALWIAGCLVPVEDDSYARNCPADRGHENNRRRVMEFGMTAGSANENGRWPANVCHDGSDEVLACFPIASGQLAPVTGKEPSAKTSGIYNGFNGRTEARPRVETRLSAARFFYCAKASRADREAGCENLGSRARDGTRKEGDPGGGNPRNRGLQPRKNFHPTVKPTELMRWLCRLVTPKNGTVLDPFMGSGTTGCAAAIEGLQFIGIEREADYIPIARARIAEAQGPLFAAP